MRAHWAPALVEMSDACAQNTCELKQFLRDKLYRHYRVQRMTRKARSVVQQTCSRRSWTTCC